LPFIDFAPYRVYYIYKSQSLYPKGFFAEDIMTTIGNFIKQERRKLGLTQQEFALRSGLGLRFIRDLEQGKETVRMDKVNQALRMFGMEAVPGRMEKQDE
jgi:y4mF family transcriptional regulator